MPVEGRHKVISDVLDGGILLAAERRELLMNHELLAAAVEFFLTYPLMAEDKGGLAYLPLKHGKRAYNLDQFLECLQREREHFARLTSLVRKALFTRFVQDAAAAA